MNKLKNILLAILITAAFFAVYSVILYVFFLLPELLQIIIDIALILLFITYVYQRLT